MKNLYLAVAYVLLGQFGLLFAIPPGYASPVFPAVGLAVAVTLVYGLRYCRGVWAGSFVLNLWLVWEHGALSYTSTLMCVLIGTGAALQAAVAARLVDRFQKDEWRHPGGLKSIIRYLLIIGPLSCLVSASLGVTALVVFGSVETAWIGNNWLMWWVGDSLGVLLFTPVIIALFLRDSEVYSRRIRYIFLPSAILFLCILLIVQMTFDYERKRENDDLRNRGDAIADQIEKQISDYENIIFAINSYVKNTNNLTYDQFVSFTKPFLDRYENLHAVSWNPVVRDEERNEFESALASEMGIPGLQITERNSKGKLVTASRRERYVVVKYISPLQGNRPALAFDISSNGARYETIQTAREQGDVTITSPIRLVQENREHPGFLMLYPVYKLGKQAGDRRNDNWPDGFAVGVFKMDELIQALVYEYTRYGMGIHLIDAEAEQSRQEIYKSEIRFNRNLLIEKNYTLNIAGRRWLLTVTSGHEYLMHDHAQRIWLVFVICILVALFMQASLLGFVSRLFSDKKRISEQEREISHRIRIESAIRTARKEAEQANELKSEFLSKVTHEIRTPLNGVIGLALVGAKDSVTEPTRRLFRQIGDCGEQLLTIVNDILDFSKVENGELECVSATFDMHALLDRLVTVYAKKADDKGLEFEHEVCQHLCKYYKGDVKRLEQVLTHLLGNAIKFTEKGKVQLKAGTDDDGKTLIFSVVDTGIGLTQSEISRLFVPFSQIDGASTRRYGGNGLGLAICQRIAHLMGGDLQVTSISGMGSTFSLSIQLTTVDSASEEVRALEKGVQIKLENRHVLVVDGMGTECRRLQEQLQTNGLGVICMDNALEAVEYIESSGGKNIDVVLMDVHTPVLNGIEACRMIHDLYPDLPVIGMTDHMMKLEKERAIDEGMLDYLVKPLDIGIVLATIRRVLDQ